MESSVEVSQMGGPKPSVAPKPRLTPKPFSLQKNTTIRSINAPKATGVTSRTTTQRTDKSKAKPPASTPAQKPPKQTPASDSQPSPVSVLKEELPKTARESKASPDGEDAPDSGVGKSDPVTQTAPPKETPKSESIRRDDVNQANRDASSDVVNTPQIHGKKKGDETPTSAVQNTPDSGSNASSADNAENRWGGGRKRLSMKLTSKFESVGVSLPPQPTIPATSTKDDASKPEVPDPEPGHATSKPSDREIDEGALKEEYSGGGSIKRRISLLFDSSSRPEPMTKRDEPEVVNSTEGVKGVKERMKIWAMETAPDGTKAENPPRVAPRNRSKRLQPATAPTAVKTPEIPTVKPPVTGTLSSQPVDLPSKVSPAEPPTDIPMETNKDAATEDKLSKSWRVEHAQNRSTDVDVQLRKRSSFKTHTAADEGVPAEGDSAQQAPKRDNVKRRSVRFSVVERDDGGPPVFLGSASDSSDEEEGEASEDGAEEEIPVSVPVYRRVGGLQRKDDDDDDDNKEGERLKHLEFEKKRRSEEHDQPELKMEDELKREVEEEEEDEEEREKETARQKKEEARKQDSLKEERIERQKREEWEREQLIEKERKQERFREEEMEREKQMEMLLQRQREEERKSAKQKEQREKERLKEVERKEERLRQEREKQKFSEDAINEEKKREDEWEKEWVKKTERLRGEKEKGGENDLELMEQRQKEERLREEREGQRGRKDERLIGNHADYHLEGKLRETEINKKKQREEEWEKQWVKVTESLRGEDEEEELMLQRKTEEDRERARQNEERLRQEERKEERLRDEEKERERERQRRLKAQQEKEETERKRQREEEEERKRQAEREEERKRQREEEEERKRQAEQEEERKRQAERAEERKRHAEREEERKRQAEREEERKRQREEEEERKRQAEREEERKRQREEEEERKRQAEQEEERKRQAERAEERKRHAEREEERKRQAEREEERKRQREEEEERKRQAEREEERKRQREEEEERKRQADREEERKRQAEREEERKRQREEEEERKRQADREEERKRQAERERIEALVRQDVDRKREQDLEEKLRLEEERGREEIESAVDTAKSNLFRFDSKDVPLKSEFPNSPTAKSSQPTEGQLKVVYDDFSVRPPLAQVVFDDFSVKPKRWGSQAKVETSPLGNSRSAVSADKEEVQVTLDVTNRALEQVEKPGSPEPTLSWENPKKEEEELISMEEDEEDDEEEEEEEEEEEGGEEKETQREDEVEEEDEQEAPVNSYSTNSEDTDALIDNEPDDHNGAREQTSETDGPKLVPDQVPEVSEDVDATDFHREPEHAPFPESSTDLLDTSAQRSKADLGKRRNRTRPSRSLRGGFSHLESTDWRIDDSTDEKEASSKQREVDSEDEQPKPKIICSPPPTTSQRVPMFSGLNPAALIAQLKKRTSGGRTGGGGEAEEDKGRGVKESRKEEVAPSPSQLPRSPRSAAHLAGAARVLPPLGATDQGAVSSPAWLKELKSKKRLSQYDSGT